MVKNLMSGKKIPMKNEFDVTVSNGKLWGSSGGELEYVGQRVEFRKRGDQIIPVMVLLFTDHDHWHGDDGELEPNVFYKTELAFYRG
jgi:hypothetical protein